MLHLTYSIDFLPIYKCRHPSIKHAFLPSHPLAQNGTDIQAHTYHADSDRTPSPGWARFPFSGSSHPQFVAPSCAWDCAVNPTCSHVDVDRTVAATSRTGYALPFLLPLLPVSLLRGGVAKELPGAVNHRWQRWNCCTNRKQNSRVSSRPLSLPVLCLSCGKRLQAREVGVFLPVKQLESVMWVGAWCNDCACLWMHIGVSDSGAVPAFLSINLSRSVSLSLFFSNTLHRSYPPTVSLSRSLLISHCRLQESSTSLH